MNNPRKFLQNVLLADGLTSGFTGLGVAALPGTVAFRIGTPHSSLVAIVGLGLLAFGATLVHWGRKESAARSTARFAVAMNLAWLAGSAIVLLGGWLSPLGRWALVLVGDVVLAFTVLEVMALRRTSRSADAALNPSHA